MPPGLHSPADLLLRILATLALVLGDFEIFGSEDAAVLDLASQHQIAVLEFWGWYPDIAVGAGVIVDDVVAHFEWREYLLK